MPLLPVLAAALLLADPRIPATGDVGTAIRAAVAPVIDGKDTDAVWAKAPVHSDFRQFSPAEDGNTEFRTEWRAAYDDKALYVFIRAFDPRPDSLVALLSRRDERTNSEWLKVVIDAYHDRRNAIELMVNPAGVKRDAAIYSDIIEDMTGDYVWNVGVSVDSLGWTAEFSVPFSQLRFNAADENTFGFGIWRDIARRSQRDSWPVYRMSRQAFASQLGDLTGIRGLKKSRRLELLPYVVEKNVSRVRPEGGWTRAEDHSAGFDVKAGLGSNLTLDATVNPDFGQVEADPAVLNLTAFELRFDERRPFFQEGTGLFKCGGPCEGSFYTRRIGRTPQLRSNAADPTSTTILGAAKLTGRLANGLQVGIVEAVTAREEGVNGRTIEPRTNSFVGRLVRDFRGGKSQIGAQVTALNRELDDVTSPYLRRSAYTGIIQGLHRFGGAYEVQAYGGYNEVEGSAAAIALTQLSSVHYYQRPDIGERYDPTRTSMGGSTLAATLRKYAGAVRWESYLRRATAGLELNDLGLVSLVNDVNSRNQVSWVSLRPGTWYRQMNLFALSDLHWTTSDGLPAGTSAQLHGAATLNNFWGAALTVELANLGASHCVSCARGGPAVRQDSRATYRVNLNGDARRPITPSFDLRAGSGDGGRSWWQYAGVGVDLRFATRTSVTLAAAFENRVEGAQWVGNYGALLSDTTHFTFGRLAQKTSAITVRGNFTATPTLTFQLYAQPFIATGKYTGWMELGDSKAVGWSDRYRMYRGGTSPGGFNVKQFNSNAVMRWEYRPASTLFLVWQQGRNQNDLNAGSFVAARDYHDLFRAHPDNTLLIKLAYWFTP